MTPERLAAIRARHEETAPGPSWLDIADLLAEVERLRGENARLAPESSPAWEHALGLRTPDKEPSDE